MPCLRAVPATVSVSLAVTHKEGFVVGIQAFPDNPYDGHTTDGQLDQIERLTWHQPRQGLPIYRFNKSMAKGPAQKKRNFHLP